MKLLDLPPLSLRDELCLPPEAAYDYMGLRIASVFVVFVSSAVGVLIPLVSSGFPRLHLPHWLYFFARYFGSGVIVATAFIHLLYEAHVNLSSPCLSDTFRQFPYAFGIALVGIFATFLIEIVTKYKVSRKHGIKNAGGITESGCSHGPAALATSTERNIFAVKHNTTDSGPRIACTEDEEAGHARVEKVSGSETNRGTSVHEVPKPDTRVDNSDSDGEGDAKLALQVSNICLLEFGIVFHSIFVGLSVAVSGSEFKTLFPVIVFHQLFEGMGLGARLARTQWPPKSAWISWFFALLFSVTTPLGIAIGLGVRQSFEPNSPKSLISTGVFDSLAAGILIYSSLVELMGREFLESSEFDEAPLSRILGAFTWMALGAILMGLLGAWA